MKAAAPLEQQIEQAADLLRHARYAVLLSGAGFSTPSGIPDFRSPAAGLWEHADPMEVASLTTFRRQPERFFEWFHPLARAVWDARPNPAHLAVAELEERGILRAVITQNVDGLYQAAGAKNVCELHGSTRTLSCLACGRTVPSGRFFPAYLSEGALPRCPDCGAVLKPDIVFFEEMLPGDVWEEAVQHCSTCDLLLAAGSSLEVYPAAGLPQFARLNRARLIINNRTPTHLDRYADLVIREDLVRVIPAIAARL